MKTRTSKLRYEKVQQGAPTEPVTNLDGSLYVVLFNAHEGKFSHDIRWAYRVLADSGVPRKNICVLEGNDALDNSYVGGPATLGGLDSAFDSIRQNATKNDRLLVYVTNDGALINSQSVIASADGTITEGDFQRVAQDLPVNLGLFYFSQCHSGGFAERMGYGRNIGVSSVAKNEIKISFKGHVDNFTRSFLPAVTGAGSTIESAFQFASDKTASPLRKLLVLSPAILFRETPQLRYQNADPSQLYLGSVR